VAGHSTRINCILPDGEDIEATVVVHDPLTDLSVLKLVTEKRTDPKKALPHASLGDSDKLQIGDYVMAMGNPLRLSSSLTLGVVSNPRRVFVNDVGNEMEEMQLDEGETTGLFTRWIQHDADIAPGNSGGPLVNLTGDVVGINELRYGGGIGFAIPSNIAKDVLRQALERGAVRRAWLGAAFLPVMKLGRMTGALVSDIAPQSAAEKAGLKAGDILVKLNGAPTDARFFEEVPLVYQRISVLEIGKPAALDVLREGKPVTLQVVPTLMEDAKGDEDGFREVGATAEQVTATRALLERLPVNRGVQITGVRAGHPFEAAQPAIAAGDIVVAIGGQPVSELAGFRKAIQDLPDAGRSVVFRRRGEILVTEVKPLAEKGPDVDTELPRPWLGVKIQVLTAEVARALGLPKPGGYRITQVYDATEAAKAGLQPGDVIVSLNGQAVKATRTQDSEDLKQSIEALSVGDTAKLGLLRAGKPESLSVALQPTPKSASQAKIAKQSELEFAVREIVPMDRMESRRFRGVRGVLVSDVTQGGWAAMAGLNVEDIVLSVGGAPTPDTETFETVMASVLKQRPKTIPVSLQREFRTHFVFVEPDWAKLKPVAR
jgi:serine protease Do